MSIRRTAKQSLSVTSFCIVYMHDMHDMIYISLHISGDFIKPVSTRLKLALAFHINRAFWVDCAEMLVQEMKVGLIWARGGESGEGRGGVVKMVRWRYDSKDLHRCEIRIPQLFYRIDHTTWRAARFKLILHQIYIGELVIEEQSRRRE